MIVVFYGHFHLNITSSQVHYGNTHIQIYLKLYHQKCKFSDKKSDIFHIFAQKHRLWVLVRTASSMFLSRNKKNNVYPCIPQFSYIKVGF